MNQRQWKNLVQLLGLGSLAYGLYTVWAEYRVYAGINAGLNSLMSEMGAPGMENTFLGFMDGFGYGLGDMLLRSPWVWAGVLLIVAPYLIGLGSRSHHEPVTPTQQLDLYVQCGSCGEAVRETAPFCPHCGAAR